MNITAERLYGYDPLFSPGIVEEVAEVAEWQAQFSNYGSMFDAMGISDIDEIKRRGIVDIRQKEEGGTLVYHSPMGVPLDANQLYQIATIAKANPNKRLVAQGNAGGKGYYAKALSYSEQKKVASGNLKPIVEPVLRYLDWQNVDDAEHAGYSLGAALATVAVAHGEQSVEKTVLIEPPSVVERPLGDLVMKFLMSGKQLDKYVEAAGSENFNEARKNGSMMLYLVELLRPTNIATGRALARGNFRHNLGEALCAHPEMISTVITGDESELAPKLPVHEMVVHLRNKYGPHRVRHMRLPGQTHALTNDIYLNAVLVREGLK